MVILIIALGVCIPIAAIVTSHQYRMQKLKMESGEGFGEGKRLLQLEKYVRQLADENEDLKKRLGNVETIISDPDFLLGMPKQDESHESQKKLEQLAELIKKG